MDIIKKIAGRLFPNKKKETVSAAKQEMLRRCYFEVMEQRRVLSADPVIAAVTFLEGDSGQDNLPDHFEVTFQGGSDATELTQFTINGDQDASGNLTDGDVFFDFNDQLPGSGESHPFQFDAVNSEGIQVSDVRSVQLSPDGLSLTVSVDNFEAGDIFAFTIDVDEAENRRTDRITSGIEFETSLFQAEFFDENFTFNQLDVEVDAQISDGFVQNQTPGLFYDEYNGLLDEAEAITGQTIDLLRDNESLQRNRTAGAIDAFELQERPISIEGNVFHDDDLDCVHDGTEEGIEGVQIDLQRLVPETGQYVTVASTTTDADGHYRFGEELDIRPGTFRLVQTQPDGFLNVGESAGSEGGSTSENVISNIVIPLGGTAATEYNFKEIRPAQLSGNVFHDADDDGIFDPDEEGIANVLIQINRVGAKSDVSNDVFADFDSVFVRTDANGRYVAEQLPPGIYEIIEINNVPDGEVDPLAGFIDGQDRLGTVDGATVGNRFNDRFTEVELCPDGHGTEFNFGELRPASISGSVSVVTPGSDPNDPTDPLRDPIEGVTIQLLDENGDLVATTLTDANGDYEFAGLAPGEYSIVQVQPDGFLDGSDHVGNVDGVINGAAVGNDRFEGIVLGSGDEGVRYDFCEHIPADISGTVFHDRNNDGIQNDGEEGIANVTIMLFDADGNVVAETLTDALGNYQFVDLKAGEYMVYEVQPVDFTDGIDSVGTVDGVTVGQLTENDKFSNITIDGGDSGVEYNFGEFRTSSISGLVHIDVDVDGQFDPNSPDQLLPGVSLELLDEDGNVLATTVTDAEGRYTFDNLVPGTYAVRQIQPDGLFSGGEHVGDAGGVASENLLTNIVISSDTQADGYNFCEHLPAEIHGRVFEDGPAIETEDGLPVPGFRDLRDAVFTAGVDTPIEGVRLRLYFFNTDDSVVPRPVTLADVQSEFYTELGTDPNTEISVLTDAQGNYWFQGLQAGSYIVLQEQPDGFVDSTDVVGSTTGFTFNDPADVDTAPESLITTFSSEQILDAVSNIQVQPGGVSQFNNFSEVTFVAAPEPPPEPTTPTIPQPIPPTPQLTPSGIPPTAGLTGFPGLLGSQTPARSEFVGNTRGLFETTAQAGAEYQQFAWHLSIINGGQPRAVGELSAEDNVWSQVSHLQNNDWQRFDTDDAVWSFTTTDPATGQIQETGQTTRFGVLGGTPLAGDFDGDGLDEVATFKDGYWLIDVNHNGRWDSDDLLATLGDADDRPVVGDWDGDGKDDIGIYGPSWEHDDEAIESDPGLPNPENERFNKPKNVPPIDREAADGARVMQLTSSGDQRADVVDHVFGTGDESQQPVTGDWNGNGIRSIGTFENGQWNLDVNGDGRFDSDDVTATFGQAGDAPVVGDFNGDGIEQIAIYRAGTWMVDSNGNHELDATDRTFQLGTAGDTPIVGDWDGDGIDEPALYRESKLDDVN